MAQSPVNNLMQDPAFAAFIAASGMGEELAMADAARRRSSINQALGIQQEGIGEKGEQNRRGIRGNFESRGVLSSGQALQEESESERDTARQQALAQLSATEQLGDIESGLLTGQVNRQFDTVQRGLDAAGRLNEEAGDDDISARLKALEGMDLGTTGLEEYTPGAMPGPAKPIADVAISRQAPRRQGGPARRAF